MELFVWALDSEVKSLHRHNVRLRIIGDTSRFNSRLQERIRKSEALTAGNTGLTLNIAANYGGRWDIVQVESGNWLKRCSKETCNQIR